MNIETANRLLQYRKRNNLSQEELAEKIGVSRQAVSKWERAEASPDTDNLIELSKIYGVTLDELISGETEKQAEEKTADKKSIHFDFSGGKQVNVEFLGKDDGGEGTDDDSAQNEAGEPPLKDHISFKHGIHVHSKNGDKVDIGLGGIHVHDKKGDKVDVGWDGIYVEENGKKHVYTDENGEIIIAREIERREEMRRTLNKLPFVPVVVLLYLIFGFLNICGGWAAGWIILLTIPLYYSLVDAVCRRRPDSFAFPVLVAAVYLWLGMFYSLWHPYWILFFTIPFYYCITDIFKHGKSNKENSEQEHNEN